MIETALTAFTTFFAVIGPIDSAVLVASLTPNATKAERRAIALKAVAIATLIVLAFALFGQPILTQLGVSLHVIRTSAPLLLLAGCAAGIAAFYYNAVPRSVLEGNGAEPVLATARALPPAAVSPPASAAARSAATTTGRVPVPDELAGKLQFAVLAAELSAGGIDARRERGEPKLVAWSAVVGAVARRLPADAPYAGHAFVDVVSTSGSTLRFLPWTRITGELRTDPADDGVVRARRFLKQVVARCPAVHLDRATRAFLDGGDPPIQLPDAAVLAAHDERLA